MPVVVNACHGRLIHMLEKLMKPVRAMDLTITGWMTSFGSILVIRYFLESLSSPPVIGGVLTNILTMIHYSFFFLTVALSLLSILFIFAPQHKDLSARLLLLGMLVIFLAPILDLVLTAGKGAQLSYLIDDTHRLWYTFLTFFFYGSQNGSTAGIRIEIAIIVFSLAGYVYYCTKSWMRALGSFLISYTSVIFFIILPTVFAAIAQGHRVTSENLSMFYLLGAKNSVLMHTLVEPMYVFKDIQGFFGTYFNSIVAQIFLIVLLVVGSLAAYLFSKKTFLAVIKNTRPERILYYILLSASGIAFSNYLGYEMRWNWVSALSLTTLFISIACAWVSAVFYNDSADVEIDKSSNASRPIPQGILTPELSRQIGTLFLFLSLSSAFLIGNTHFFLMLLYAAVLYIYSMKPLRLKQFFPVNSLLIAFAGMIAIYSGFFFAVPAVNLHAYPLGWALAAFFSIYSICHIRDIKDIKGDSEAGIQTIPVLFGELRGRQIIGTLTALITAFCFPLLLKLPLLLFISVPLGIFNYYWITTKKHPEAVAFGCFFGAMGLLLIYFLSF